MSNIKNKYGFIIGQQVGDMMITDMYVGNYNHLVLCLKCIVCGFEKTMNADKAKDNPKGLSHGFRCKPFSVKDQYPIGTVINDMVIIGYSTANNGGTNLECKCNVCGNIKSISSTNIRIQDGASKHESCNKPKHNDYNGLSYQNYRFYNIWLHMKDRIYNVNHPSYPNYGGRGLTTDYDNYEDFYNDLIESYNQHVLQYGEQDTTLDRINNNLGYIKDNLRWVTRQEQGINKRHINNRLFIAYDPNGNIYLSNCISEFAKNHNLDPSSISNCLNCNRESTKGWKFYDNCSVFIPLNVIQEFYYV